MRRFYWNRNNILALSLALGICTVAGGYAGYRMASDPSRVKDGTNNEIGFDDLSLWWNFKVKENHFVMFDVGNHQKRKTAFERQKLEYCNEHDIAAGIIISTSAEDESEIYDDVEFVKGMIAKYQIDFPVFLNIDAIITNDALNVEMKTKLMKDFLEKCSTNNIYVGVYGTDTNLCRMKKYCNLTEYDAFLVMDQVRIAYDGTYHIVKDLDGNITSDLDLEAWIDQKQWNRSDRFVRDGAYTLRSPEELLDVAMQYGMSVDELLAFNGLNKKEVEIGTVLRLPMVIEKSMPNNKVVQFTQIDNPLRGCDLSYAQGTNADWEKLAENFSFAILKCSQGTTIDPCFENNILQCGLNDIAVGVYCYNDFHYKNYKTLLEFTKAEEKQAEFVLQCLKNKEIQYPVFLDIEVPSGDQIKKYYPKEYIQAMILIWEEKMSTSGYVPGIYCNKSMYAYISSCVSKEQLERMQVWIAGGNQYSGGTKDYQLGQLTPMNATYQYDDQEYQCQLVQATDSAINTGAGNHLGHVDVNFSYIDYENPVITEQLSGEDHYAFETKQFDRIPFGKIAGITFVGGFAAILAGPPLINMAMKKKLKRKVHHARRGKDF